MSKNYYTAYRFEELSICILSVQKIKQILPACAHAGQIFSDNEFVFSTLHGPHLYVNRKVPVMSKNFGTPERKYC